MTWPSKVTVNTGTTTNDNAAAGIIGEFIISTILIGAAIGMTTNTPINITSISLSPGDWDVAGDIDFHPSASTVTTYYLGGVSLVSGTFGTAETTVASPFAIATTAVDASQVIPVVRVSIAVQTTIYLVANAGFTVNTLTAYGSLRARRMR
jgi:hypothetical protein